jgi:hypothetical protein
MLNKQLSALAIVMPSTDKKVEIDIVFNNGMWWMYHMISSTAYGCMTSVG